MSSDNRVAIDRRQRPFDRRNHRGETALPPATLRSSRALVQIQCVNFPTDADEVTNQQVGVARGGEQFRQHYDGPCKLERLRALHLAVHAAQYDLHWIDSRAAAASRSVPEEKRKGPLFQEGPFRLSRLSSPGSSQQQARHYAVAPGVFAPVAKLFCVLTSFWSSSLLSSSSCSSAWVWIWQSPYRASALLAYAPPLGVAAYGTSSKTNVLPYRLFGIIETRYVGSKTFAINLERNFKSPDHAAKLDYSRFKIVFRHKAA